MWCARLVLLCALICWAAPALAEQSIFLSPADITENEEGSFSFTLLPSRTPPRKISAAKGREFRARICNPAHLAVTGFGADSDRTLLAIDDPQKHLTAVLGAAKPLPTWQKGQRMYGYASARPGDATVVLVQMGYEIFGSPDEVEALVIAASPEHIEQEYRRYRKHYTPAAGVHAGLATQSGLRLGLSPAEVEAVLGPPLHKDRDTFYSQFIGWMTFSPEMLRRWGWPKDSKAKQGGFDITINVRFDDGKASCIFLRKRYQF